MSLPLSLEAEASGEARQATIWYEMRRLGLGGEFLDAVENALARIVDLPRSGRSVGSTGKVTVRSVPVGRFPYQIIYVDAPDELRVLAVVHDKQKPGLWRQRI